MQNADQPAPAGQFPCFRVMGEAECEAHAQTIGARMRLARTRAGLTMGQVARMRGVTVPAVSDLERFGLHAELWVQWCASAYGVSIRWLRTGVLQAPDLPDAELANLPDVAILILGAM